ncbi:MAG: flagellar export protein FliJ [Treponema sp.]|jgi:flagellar FliJ protein|nr:flagellar export protein FliJ [Treponema sp.]
MKKFNFSLQKVLQLRKFREEECKIELGQAISNLNLIESEIKKTAVKRQSAAQQRFIATDDIGAWDNYILRLDQEAMRLTEKAAQAEIIVEEKRALYLEASKELKTLEKLKEKREKEYRKEALDLQMAEVDDLTASRYDIAVFT